MSPDAPALTFKRLLDAVTAGATAVRVVTRLVPAGGDGDKVFPPTYKNPDGDAATYAYEERRFQGRQVKTVLLDSVASQANRMEQALLGAVRDGLCNVPILFVTVPRGDGGSTRVTTLDAPHRVTDAIFRDSQLGGKSFRESHVGKQIIEARQDNATALFRYCPTALLFGFWDSQGGAGVHGAKFARSLVSEIVGHDAVAGRGTGSRVDPLAISAGAAKIYRADQDTWTLDEGKATVEKGKRVLFGKGSKAGKPSAVNHGNVTPSLTAEGEPGGVTISEAAHSAVLSLPQLRRLRFPPPNGTCLPERDAAARTVLAALALYAIALQADDGYSLRSRCHLIPLAAPKAELLGRTAEDVETFSLPSPSCGELLKSALHHAQENGLEWENEPIELSPSEKLVELVRRSDAKLRAEGGDDAGD